MTSFESQDSNISRSKTHKYFSKRKTFNSTTTKFEIKKYQWFVSKPTSKSLSNEK